jgi:hypothetical protein
MFNPCIKIVKDCNCLCQVTLSCKMIKNVHIQNKIKTNLPLILLYINPAIEWTWNDAYKVRKVWRASMRRYNKNAYLLKNPFTTKCVYWIQHIGFALILRYELPIIMMRGFVVKNKQEISLKRYSDEVKLLLLARCLSVCKSFFPGSYGRYR